MSQELPDGFELISNDDDELSGDLPEGFSLIGDDEESQFITDASGNLTLADPVASPNEYAQQKLETDDPALAKNNADTQAAYEASLLDPDSGNVVDVASPAVEPAAEKRTYTGGTGEAIGMLATDAMASFGSGANALVKIAGDIYGLTSGNMDNALSEAGKSGQAYWQQRKTPALIEAEQARKAAVDSAVDSKGKAGAAWWGTVSNPLLMTSFILEQGPMLLPVGWVGAGAKAGATAMGAGAKVAGTVGTGAAVTTGAAMSGADSGSQAFDKLMGIDTKIWETNPDYIAMVNDGVDPAIAKHQIAVDLSQNAAIATGVVSGALNAIPAARFLEKAVSGVKLPAGSKVWNAIKGFIAETGTEGVEEGFSTFAANVASGVVDDRIDSMEGVGEAAGMGAAAGPFGAVAGAVAPAELSPEQELAQELDFMIENSGFKITADEAAAKLLDPASAVMEVQGVLDQYDNVDDISAAAQQLLEDVPDLPLGNLDDMELADPISDAQEAQSILAKITGDEKAAADKVTESARHDRINEGVGRQKDLDNMVPLDLEVEGDTETGTPVTGDQSGLPLAEDSIYKGQKLEDMKPVPVAGEVDTDNAPMEPLDFDPETVPKEKEKSIYADQKLEDMQPVPVAGEADLANTPIDKIKPVEVNEDGSLSEPESTLDSDLAPEVAGNIEQPEDQNDALVKKARAGDKEAQKELESYGLKWEQEPVARFVSQSEVDALNAGETITGKGEQGVDVTKNVEGEGATASDTDYRVTLNESFDDKLSSQKIQMKNEQDGWVKAGYAKGDVAKIEKRNEDGSWTEVKRESKKPIPVSQRPKEVAKEKPLKDIRINEDAIDPEGNTIQLSRKADVVIREIDTRIDSSKQLGVCIRG